MMLVYRETLPASYLLVLGPAVADDTGTELSRWLATACRSGRPAIWIDCRLLDALPTRAACLLWALHLRLRRCGRQLLLCRVSAGLTQQLARVAPPHGPALHLVPTLDAAAAYPTSLVA